MSKNMILRRVFFNAGFNSRQLVLSADECREIKKQFDALIDHIAALEQQLASERRHSITNSIQAFVTDDDIKALNRFAECCDDPESGGHDLEKEQVTRLEKIGALQRSGRISYITDFGDLVLSLRMPVEGE